MTREQWVEVVHPGIPSTHQTPALMNSQSFFKVWSKKGWVLKSVFDEQEEVTEGEEQPPEDGGNDEDPEV